MAYWLYYSYFCLTLATPLSIQVNNCLAFPGFGSGCIVSGSNKVTTTMQLAAAAAIAGLVRPDELRQESILPRIGRLEEVAQAVCKAVVAAARYQV
jgi:malate dehydrogenase (oxaloacetate-decarboxylating)